MYSMDNPLSFKNIKDYFDNKIKVIVYSDLLKYRTIEEALYPYNRVVILCLWKPSYGHYIAVFKNVNNNIEVFDSLKNKFIDGVLDIINPDFKKQYKQDFKYLSLLLYNYNGNVEWSDRRLQDKNSQTCGKWCCYRLYRDDLTIEDFYKLFTKNKYKENDKIIISLYNITQTAKKPVIL